MRETWVWPLGGADALEKEMATHSSTLAWKIPWMEEPGRLQSMGLQRVGHDWAASQVQVPHWGLLTEGFCNASVIWTLINLKPRKKASSQNSTELRSRPETERTKAEIEFLKKRALHSHVYSVFSFYNLLCGILTYLPGIWTMNIGQKNQLHWNTSVNCKTEAVWTWRALLHPQQPRWKQPVSTNEWMDKEGVKKIHKCIHTHNMHNGMDLGDESVVN